MGYCYLAPVCWTIGARLNPGSQLFSTSFEKPPEVGTHD